MGSEALEKCDNRNHIDHSQLLNGNTTNDQNFTCDNHAYLRLQFDKLEKIYEKECHLIGILEKDEIDRIESAMKIEETAIQTEYEVRLNELVEGMYNEYEEKKRGVESEISGMDIASTSSSNSYFYGYPNKKTLRRRANEQSETNEKKPRKHSPQNIVHLLPESAIADDVKLICNYPNTKTSASIGLDDEGRHRKVTVDNGKLVCDGKIFHKGQSVSVETVNYGKFPAIIQIICEKFVQFRSSLPGDTRLVTATTKDFECETVIVRKRY
jgi:hypothetical protein